MEQIPRLRRYARSLTGDMEQADDLVQDCLERACRKVALWRPGSDIRAWLFTILHNLYVSKIRQLSRRGSDLPLNETEVDERTANPEAGLEWRDVERGLAQLPPEQREVLLMVALEGMRYEDVALVLDIPLGTVMSRLFRARERLRRWAAGEPGPRLRRVK
ncbi:MAG: sigma-70 family RNA polymerase sigma factor [Gammaproteobacteria bacterium]